MPPCGYATMRLCRYAAMPLHSELLQHAQIVLEQRPDVGDVELEHRNAVDAEAEGEAAPLLGVDADVAQHLRVHHAAAEDLHPAGLRTGAAAGALAEDARHVDFRARLRERKKARAHAHLRVGT